MTGRVFTVTVLRSRWRRQRWYVRLTWASNGQTAMHSETYRDRRDADNLAAKLAALPHVEQSPF